MNVIGMHFGHLYDNNIKFMEDQINEIWQLAYFLTFALCFLLCATIFERPNDVIRRMTCKDC